LIITSRAEVVSINVDVAASKAFAKLLEVERLEANVTVVPSVSNSPFAVLCNVKDVVKDDVTVTSSNGPVPTVGVVGVVSVVLNEVLSNKVSE